MSFDYNSETKTHYKDDAVAEAYYRSYVDGSGIDGKRSRFIAAKEREAVSDLLRKVSHSTVLDIPTGTGKMAGVLGELGSKVTACDVSENMLTFAKKSYAQQNVSAKFEVVDLETASTSLDEHFDTVVCIRLMHRVPDDVKRRMLQQVSRLGDNAIISFGIDSSYHRARQRIRRALIGGHDVGSSTRLSLEGTRALLGEFFAIKEERAIAPLISAERVFLVNPV